ncbi:MAG TPA: class I SAM-dependent methyltransferase [Blastocatellia bacterium]|nr:class I SAM-dependent methyltransferase [Blastocatellia bacterium]
MNELENLRLPRALTAIQEETAAVGFPLASDLLTGSILRTLVAAKPAGHFLELGTGTGVGTSWILDGMDQESRLWSFDSDSAVQAVARKYLGHDARVTFCNQDAGAWLGNARAAQFDLIFADAWPGKYSHLDDALRALKAGGLYVIDDMLPQPAWPEGHSANVAALLSSLEARTDLTLTRLCWSTGLLIAAKT